MPPKVKAKLETDEEVYAKTVERAGEAVKRFGTAFANVGRAISSILTAPLARLAAPAADAASSYRETTNRIRQATGATGAQLEALTAASAQVRSASRAGLSDAATAVTTFSQRLGLVGDDLRDAAVAAVKLAQGVGGDVKPVAEALTQTMAAWGVTGHAVGDAIGRLRDAARTAEGGVIGLSARITGAAPALKAAGLSLDDSVALVADLEQHGVPADEALGGLTKAVTKITQDLGAGSTGVRASLLEHINAIRAVDDPAAQAALAVDLFGKKGVLMADAIRRGALSMDRVQNLGRVPAPAAVARLGKSFADLRIKVEEAFLPIGKAVQGVLVPAVSAALAGAGVLVDAGAAVTRAFADLPEWLQSTIVIVGGVLALVGPVLLFAGSILEVAAFFGGKGLIMVLGLDLVPKALAALAVGGAAGAALGFARGLPGVSGAGVPAAVASAAIAIGGIVAPVDRASGVIADRVGKAIDRVGVGARPPEMPRLNPLPGFTAPPPAKFDPSPVPVPGYPMPAVQDVNVPPAPSWQGAFDWFGQFASAMARTSTPVFTGVPMYRDVRQIGAAQDGDALRLLSQIGRLKGVAYNTKDLKPDELAALLQKALGTLTLGDTYRLHAWDMEPVYNDLRRSIVGPTPILDMNSPEAWMTRATEVDRLVNANRSRDQFFMDQYTANTQFWTQHTNERNAWSTWNANQQQQALMMANPRPNVYLPEDVFRAAEQGWQQAFGSARPGGSAAPPAPPPAPPKKTTAPQIGNLAARVGSKAPTKAPAPAPPPISLLPARDKLEQLLREGVSPLDAVSLLAPAFAERALQSGSTVEKFLDIAYPGMLANIKISPRDPSTIPTKFKGPDGIWYTAQQSIRAARLAFPGEPWPAGTPLTASGSAIFMPSQIRGIGPSRRASVVFAEQILPPEPKVVTIDHYAGRYDPWPRGTPLTSDERIILPQTARMTAAAKVQKDAVFADEILPPAPRSVRIDHYSTGTDGWSAGQPLTADGKAIFARELEQDFTPEMRKKSVFADKIMPPAAAPDGGPKIVRVDHYAGPLDPWPVGTPLTSDEKAIVLTGQPIPSKTNSGISEKLNAVFADEIAPPTPRTTRAGRYSDGSDGWEAGTPLTTDGKAILARGLEPEFTPAARQRIVFADEILEPETGPKTVRVDHYAGPLDPWPAGTPLTTDEKAIVSRGQSVTGMTDANSVIADTILPPSKRTTRAASYATGVDGWPAGTPLTRDGKAILPRAQEPSYTPWVRKFIVFADEILPPDSGGGAA